MNDDLPVILRQMSKPGAPSSPGFDQLVADYGRYHLVLAIVAGLFLVALAVGSFLLWRGFVRVDRRWSFEGVVYACFGALTALVAAALALIVAANVSNVVNPRAGFAGSIGLLGSPKPGSHSAQLQDAVAGWVQSDSVDVPALLQSAIDDRLAWQRPKAIVCTILLVVFVVLAIVIWRRLIRASRPPARRGVGWVVLLIAGILCIPVCLLLMLMVMGNVQAAIAPMSMTLFFS